jgi:hypothetical protein
VIPLAGSSANRSRRWRTRPALAGGLLNATLGNAAELIIALAACGLAEPGAGLIQPTRNLFGAAALLLGN